MSTPTTETVKARYHLATVGDSTPNFIIERGRERSGAEFDRWLNEERAKAFFEGVQHQWTHRPIGNRSPHNPYRKD